MSLLRTRRRVLSLALSLFWPATVFAQSAAPPPAAQTAGYHWRTLALTHAAPSDILTLMHWNGPAAAPTLAALPDGVRRIFALQSTNSLLVEGTDQGLATVAKLVKVLDTPPRQVVFQMELVTVPKARASLYTPDTTASRLLPLLLRGASRVVAVPTETVTDGRTAFFSADVPVIPVIVLPNSWFRLAQVGPKQDRHGLSVLYAFRLTPRINADTTITLGLEFATAAPVSVQPSTPRTLRAGDMVVYDVTGPSQMDSQRLFLFLQTTIIGESGESEAVKPNGDSSVTVTP